MYNNGQPSTQNGVLDHLQRRNGCDDEGIDYLHKETTYTDILSKHGYYCALSGMYHLGYNRMTQHSLKHWYVHIRKWSIHWSCMSCSTIPTVSPLKDTRWDGAIDFLSSYTFWYTTPHLIHHTLERMAGQTLYTQRSMSICTIIYKVHLCIMSTGKTGTATSYWLVLKVCTSVVLWWPRSTLFWWSSETTLPTKVTDWG